LSFEADCKKTHPAFSVYEQNGGQGHDAGFDSFMTGLVFATLAKFIEVGNIVNPEVEPTNKRTKKSSEKERASIKHYSEVQNSPIFWADIEKHKNKVLMNIEVPQFWYLNPKDKLSAEEVKFAQKLNEKVAFITLV
jgi:hypothetical protein